MKSIFQSNDTGKGRDSFAPRRQGSSLPRVEYNFQATAADFSGRCHGEGAPSFRTISSDYFSNEARVHFVIEAFLFATIAMIVSVPVIEGIRGLAQFVFGVL